MALQLDAASEAPVAAPPQPAASAAASVAGLADKGAAASTAPVAIAVPGARASASPDARYGTTDTHAASAPGDRDAGASPDADVFLDQGVAAEAWPLASPLAIVAIGVLVAGAVLVVGRLLAKRLA